jgi:hypothetical protein
MQRPGARPADFASRGPLVAPAGRGAVARPGGIARRNGIPSDGTRDIINS